MKKIILFSLLATSSSLFANDGFTVPDGGSSALLLLVAGAAIAAAKGFKNKR